MKEKIKLTLAILYQKDYKTQNLDIDINVDKVKVNDNNLVWTKKQY